MDSEGQRNLNKLNLKLNNRLIARARIDIKRFLNPSKHVLGVRFGIQFKVRGLDLTVVIFAINSINFKNLYELLHCFLCKFVHNKVPRFQ